MRSFVVLLDCEGVGQSTFVLSEVALHSNIINVLLSTCLQSYKTAKVAFHTYNYILTLLNTICTIDWYEVNNKCIVPRDSTYIPRRNKGK